LSSVQIEQLFSALTSTSKRNKKERVVAAWALGRAPLAPVEREAAAGSLLHILDTRSQSVQSAWLRAWLRYGIVFPFALAFDIAENSGPVVTMLLLPIILGTSVVQDLRTEKLLRSYAALSLGRRQAVEGIGALAAATFDRDARVRDSAASGLHEALPAVMLEHFGLLKREEISELAKVLEHPDNLLVFKVLGALDKIGTGVAIPAVEALRNRARIGRMQQEAERVLVVLKERQKQEEMGRTLLRATSSPDAPSEILVRPVQTTHESDPAVLLRTLDT
jgi:hypothetical protein